MKKSFLYFTLAVFAAVSFTACGSDDDENNGNLNTTVTLPTPTTADVAALFSLPTAFAATSGDTNLQLVSIEISESSQILLELANAVTGEKNYIMENATVSGNTYTFDGEKASGTIKVLTCGSRQTRASVNVSLSIDVVIKILASKIQFTTGEDGVIAVKTDPTITTEDMVNWAARTWTILGATLDLKSTTKNVTAYKEFDSRGGVFFLSDIRDEALARDVSLTESEKNSLNKQIKSITLTKTGKLVIKYNNGGEDVAEWQWGDAAKTTITIKMKDDTMGNKFINDNTKINIAFRGNRCNMSMAVNFDDSANAKWDATLLLKLQY